jgi:hypothetical protein
MITTDQTLQLLNDEQLRASLRAKTNQMVLLALQANSNSSVSETSSVVAETVPGAVQTSNPGDTANDTAANAATAATAAAVAGAGLNRLDTASVMDNSTINSAVSVIDCDATIQSTESQSHPPFSPLLASPGKIRKPKLIAGSLTGIDGMHKSTAAGAISLNSTGQHTLNTTAKTTATTASASATATTTRHAAVGGDVQHRAAVASNAGTKSGTISLSGTAESSTAGGTVSSDMLLTGPDLEAKVH